MSPADALDADRLRERIGNQLIGNRIIVLEETTSTNDVVGQLAPQNSEGLVVFAERQTAGRGQYGRRWDSAAGRGLWLSVLLRPNIALADSSRLTEMLANSIADTVAATTRLAPVLKPPNDVYVGSGKIGGVLAEMRVESGGAYCAIGGLGINVNHAPSDFPEELRATAASLAMCLGHPVDRSAFAVALLKALNGRYLAFSKTPAGRAAS